MPLIDKTKVKILTPEQEHEAQLKKQKKAAQARANGKLSRGPISPEGKLISSRNAIRHGLTATQNTLLETEFPAQYNEVRDSFIDDLRPATKAELRLVEKIANLDWRLERLVMMETTILNLEVGVNLEKITSRFERIDGLGVIVEAWKESCSTSQCLDLLRRYMSTLQHQFNATLSNFRNFEKARLTRLRSGLDLDTAEPYRPPQFESIDEAPAAESIEEPTAAEQNEPTRSSKIIELPPSVPQKSPSQPPAPAKPKPKAA